MADKTRAVVVLLCLHVFAFQIVLGFLISEEVSTSPVYFFPFALLFLVLGIALGMDLRFGRTFGFALSLATIILWIASLTVAQGGGTRLPRISWVILLSIIDTFGILVGLFVLHETGPTASVPSGP